MVVAAIPAPATTALLFRNSRRFELIVECGDVFAPSERVNDFETLTVGI
jgi:hypothetical protein